MSIESGSYQQYLARTLQANNSSLSEKIIQAFSAIPRHPFVDHYYLHEDAGSRVWTKYEREELAAWYEQVYSDCALVTRVDQYGRTLSSSSQPGVMATMLDALDLQSGMRVLEVGTGSGYNAALLAHLVGDPHLVTTLDIDMDAVERARQVLPQVVGERITIIQTDGREGYSCPRTLRPHHCHGQHSRDTTSLALSTCSGRGSGGCSPTTPCHAGRITESVQAG